MLRGVDAQGSLYPMCGMNLAFNRELIGPAMYFGLMGDGQPLGRYDDMWAGWCSKVRARTPHAPAGTDWPLQRRLVAQGTI